MHINSSTHKEKRRSMDIGINLVPYIDLLMTIMAFLVMTAVWTQFTSLDVTSESGGTTAVSEQETIPVEITLKERSLSLTYPGGGAADGSFDGTIDREWLSQTLASLTPGDERLQINIITDDGVAFARLAIAIDVARGAGAQSISLH